MPFDSFWIQSLEILSSKLQSLTSILFRSQNAGHKLLSNHCFWVPSRNFFIHTTLIMFTSEEDVGNIKIFISLSFN